MAYSPSPGSPQQVDGGMGTSRGSRSTSIPWRARSESRCPPPVQRSIWAAAGGMSPHKALEGLPNLLGRGGHHAPHHFSSDILGVGGDPQPEGGPVALVPDPAGWAQALVARPQKQGQNPVAHRVKGCRRVQFLVRQMPRIRSHYIKGGVVFRLVYADDTTQVHGVITGHGIGPPAQFVLLVPRAAQGASRSAGMAAAPILQQTSLASDGFAGPQESRQMPSGCSRNAAPATAPPPGGEWRKPLPGPPPTRRTFAASPG